MKAVLLLAHGSKENNTVDTMETITKMVREKTNVDMVEEAYMQMRDKNLAKGIDNLVAKGATSVIIMPYFLFEGVHIKEDIPMEIADYMSKNPNITVTMGKTLGADERLAAIVADRISECI